MPVSAESLFSIANQLAAVGWLLMIVVPNWKVTQMAVRSGLLPVALAIGYSILIAVFWRQGEGGFDSLPAVMALFQHPSILLAGWVHYLAFDLFVGIWELSDAQRRRLPHLLVIPSLFLTFLFGPAGLLLYLVTRTVTGVIRGEDSRTTEAYRLSL